MNSQIIQVILFWTSVVSLKNINKIYQKWYNLTDDRNILESGWFNFMAFLHRKLLRFRCITNVIKKFVWNKSNSRSLSLSIACLWCILLEFHSYAASSLLFLCLFTSICVLIDIFTIFLNSEVLSRLFRLKMCALSSSIFRHFHSFMDSNLAK